MITNFLTPGGIKNFDSAKETNSEADSLENVAVIDESTLMAEQQLGLKQAEERLERDYIVHLEKVRGKFSLYFSFLTAIPPTKYLHSIA